MDFDNLVAFLSRHQKLILTAHETPDGDAIGSEMAMASALRTMGKTVLVCNADPTPETFAFLDPTKEILVLDSPELLPQPLADYALLILDVGDPNNIAQVADWVLPAVSEHFYIDHHESDGWDPLSSYVERDASSTSEILLGLFDRLGVALDRATAEALYVGIVYDTGSFVYPKTSARTLRAAARLVEAGVQPSEVYTRVYECKTISFLVLQARVQATMEFEFDRRVAIQTMTRQTILDSGSTYEEGQQLINIPLSALEVRVSIFFKENLSGLARCSLRSKGDIDVSAIARFHKGGGHRTAAGFKLSLPLEETKAKVLQQLRRYFQP